MTCAASAWSGLRISAVSRTMSTCRVKPTPNGVGMDSGESTHSSAAQTAISHIETVVCLILILEFCIMSTFHLISVDIIPPVRMIVNRFVKIG